MKKDKYISDASRREWAEALKCALDAEFGQSFRELHAQASLSDQIQKFAAGPKQRRLIELYKKVFPANDGDLELFTREFWDWPLPPTPESVWMSRSNEWLDYSSASNCKCLYAALKAKEYRPLTPARIEKCFRKLVETGELKRIGEEK